MSRTVESTFMFHPTIFEVDLSGQIYNMLILATMEKGDAVALSTPVSRLSETIDRDKVWCCCLGRWKTTLSPLSKK